MARPAVVCCDDEQAQAEFVVREVLAQRERGVDLQRQVVARPTGEEHAFEVDEFRRHCLLHGLDDIGLTLQSADAIRDFESNWRQQSPWLFDVIR